MNLEKRSYLKSEVRGRSREDPIPGSGGQEGLPHIRGQGQRLRVTACDSAGTAQRSYPMSEARGGGWEELLHIKGAKAVR